MNFKKLRRQIRALFQPGPARWPRAKRPRVPRYRQFYPYHPGHPFYVRRSWRHPQRAYTHVHSGQEHWHIHVTLPIEGGFGDLAVSVVHEQSGHLANLNLPDEWHDQFDERQKWIEPSMARLLGKLLRGQANPRTREERWRPPPWLLLPPPPR